MTERVNFINYDTIVAELEKGLRPLNSPIVKAALMNRPNRLAEFRTIGFTGCRQTGRTTWLCETIKNPAKTLVVFPSNGSLMLFEHKWLETRPSEPMPTVYSGPFYPQDDRRGISPYITDVRQFERVYIDDALQYFSGFRRGKTYNALDVVCTDDVVITLIS